MRGRRAPQVRTLTALLAVRGAHDAVDDGGALGAVPRERRLVALDALAAVGPCNGRVKASRAARPGRADASGGCSSVALPSSGGNPGQYAFHLAQMCTSKLLGVGLNLVNCGFLRTQL